MKFFSRFNSKNFKKIQTKPHLRKFNGVLYCGLPNIKKFINFITKNGFLLKYRNLLSLVFKNLDFFLTSRGDFLLENYPKLTHIINNIIYKNINFIQIFNKVIDLIKPPFIIKTVTVPKKIKKKIKQGFLLKVVYKNENKRIRSSYKQLQNYSNLFNNNKISIRLYKAVLFTFLEWDSSYLFKLKTTIFKKFFKF